MTLGNGLCVLPATTQTFAQTGVTLGNGLRLHPATTQTFAQTGVTLGNGLDVEVIQRWPYMRCRHVGISDHSGKYRAAEECLAMCANQSAPPSAALLVDVSTRSVANKQLAPRTKDLFSEFLLMAHSTTSVRQAFCSSHFGHLLWETYQASFLVGSFRNFS